MPVHPGPGEGSGVQAELSAGLAISLIAEMLANLFHAPGEATDARTVHVGWVFVDEHTIGVAAVLGTTFTGPPDDIVEACETLKVKGWLHDVDRRRAKTGVGY
jgi:hypothetical protein